MSKKNTKKNENDVVLAAKQKSKFFEEYYANLQTIQDKLTIEEINIMAKALEVATIQAKEREAEKRREEIAAKERAVSVMVPQLNLSLGVASMMDFPILKTYF